ncbi:MAG: DUF2807 domain-containing protein [Bacteroidales bacterium]|nr:DUF2807 domain-containing protein [Bacteroidales bacterium]
MKVKKVLTILISGLILILPSCEKVLFMDQGEVVVREEQFDRFTHVSFYNIFDVELQSGDEYSYRLEAHEKYMEHLFATLDSGNLVFRDSNIVKIMADYPRPRVVIRFPELEGTMLLESPVRLTSADTLSIPAFRLQSLGKAGEIDLVLNVDRFNVTTGSDNTGYYVFRGMARSARYWARGSSIMDASGLNVEDAYVFNNSIGDCQVLVSRRLEARLNSAGNVYYTGEPVEVVVTEESGTGRLIPVN